MQLIIDRENVLSLASHQPQDTLYGDVMRMLKAHFDMAFNFSKEDAFQNEGLRLFSMQFTEGRNTGLNLEFNSEIRPPRPLKQNFSNDPSFKRSVLLINDVKVQAVKDRYALIIGGVGEEVDTLKCFFLNTGLFKFERKFKIGAKHFNSWSILEELFIAQTDIIIVDNFIFSEENSIIEKNYGEILRNIHFKKGARTNVIVITLNKKGNTSVEWNFDEIKKLTVKIVTGQTGLAPNFTAVRTIARIKHDRNIFTNYLWINSGDSFNYFNTKDALMTEGDSISVSSLADTENRNVCDGIISDLQEVINHIHANNPGNIKGDKISNFLTFPL